MIIIINVFVLRHGHDGFGFGLGEHDHGIDASSVPVFREFQVRPVCGGRPVGYASWRRWWREVQTEHSHTAEQWTKTPQHCVTVSQLLFNVNCPRCRRHAEWPSCSRMFFKTPELWQCWFGNWPAEKAALGQGHTQRRHLQGHGQYHALQGQVHIVPDMSQ